MIAVYGVPIHSGDVWRSSEKNIENTISMMVMIDLELAHMIEILNVKTTSGAL